MTGNPTMTDFLGFLNQTFRICPEGMAPIPAELVSVTDLGPKPLAPAGSGERAFSLIFLMPLIGQNGNLYLRQHTYAVEHESLGMLDIFLVPLGNEKGKMQYQAIFS